MAQFQIFKLFEVRDNPYRDVVRFPLKPEKVAALLDSIGSTGFWNNVVARVDAQGQAEIAYGHHRLEAMRVFHAEEPDYEVDLIVRELDDEQMIKMMVAENMEEYADDFRAVMGAVEAVVGAFAAGKLPSMKEPAERTPPDQMRFAPSFVTGTPAKFGRSACYTAETVKDFLDWKKDTHRARDALQALEYVECEYTPDEHFVGLINWHGRILVQEIAKTRREQEEAAELDEKMGEFAMHQGGDQAVDLYASAQARAAALRSVAITQEVAAAVADTLRSDNPKESGVTAAIAEARKLRKILIKPYGTRKRPKTQDLVTWARRLCRMLAKVLAEDKAREVLDQLLEDDGEGQAYLRHLNPLEVDGILTSLDNLEARIEECREQIEAARQPKMREATPSVLRIARPIAVTSIETSRRNGS